MLKTILPKYGRNAFQCFVHYITQVMNYQINTSTLHPIQQNTLI